MNAVPLPQWLIDRCLADPISAPWMQNLLDTGCAYALTDVTEPLVNVYEFTLARAELAAYERLNLARMRAA